MVDLFSVTSRAFEGGSVFALMGDLMSAVVTAFRAAAGTAWSVGGDRSRRTLVRGLFGVGGHPPRGVWRSRTGERLSCLGLNRSSTGYFSSRDSTSGSEIGIKSGRASAAPRSGCASWNPSDGRRSFSTCVGCCPCGRHPVGEGPSIRSESFHACATSGPSASRNASGMSSGSGRSHPVSGS